MQLESDGVTTVFDLLVLENLIADQKREKIRPSRNNGNTVQMAVMVVALCFGFDCCERLMDLYTKR